MSTGPRNLASIAALSLAAACGAPPADRPVPASGLHRVEASPAAARALAARGAKVVAEYGTFQLLDVSPAALDAALVELPEGAGLEVRDGYHQILLAAGSIDTSVPPVAEARAPAAATAGRGLHLVQFAGPPRAEWLARLEASGARVVSYVPMNAYLVYGEAPALDRVRALGAAGGELQYEGPYLAHHKVDPAAAASLGAPGPLPFAVQLVEDGEANRATLGTLAALGAASPRTSAALGYVNVVATLDPATLAEVAERPDVVSIQLWAEPTLLDERQSMILAGRLAGATPIGPGWLAWLAERGFTQEQFDASAFGVDVSDSGIDAGTPTPNHFGLYRLGQVSGASRVAYVRLEGTPGFGSTLQGCDGHGTLNAHVVAGYSDRSGAPHADAAGFRYGLGVAPFVRVGGSVIFDPNQFTSPDFEDLQSRAWADGMRISSNSWGAGTASYTADCQRYDALVRDAAPDASAAPRPGNQEMVIVFAAGNAGPGAGTLGSPGNAKNVISAGASENVQAFGGPDGCGAPDAAADGALDVAYFSSRGPASDGRTRPDLLAPGTHVSGGVAQAADQRVEPPADPNGRANACFVASGVCGGPGAAYFPLGQQWYSASTGTSHSTPAIAGAAALVRQRFLNQGLPPPSPAMTKAFLVNAARYMTGAGGGDTLYSNAQGMGLVDLGAAFDEVPRELRDQLAEDLFTAAGQVRTVTSAIGDPTRPFRVTLAWTDAPGATFAAAWKNDLDLTVEVNGTTYRGNVFAAGLSVPGGAADTRNNLESVFLPAGTTGPFTVTVRAANVNSDGVPGNGTALDQDFALVITNACADAPPPVPVDVAAAPAGDNTLSVAWTPNGAPEYLVYRAAGPAGPFALAGTVAAPPLLDAGRSGGATFHYVVRARQGCAVSAPSAVASATATGPCLLPPEFAGLASAATTGEAVCGVALAWPAATPRCGGVVRYDVHRSTTAGFTPGFDTLVASVDGTQHVDGDLVGGTAYRYVVRAAETSGGVTVTEGNTVERSAVPAVVAVAFADDLDAARPPAAAAYWIERAISGPDDLTSSTCRAHSPATAWRFGGAAGICGGTYHDGVQNALVLGGDGSAGPNGLAVPAGAGSVLTFRQWWQFEACCDGASLTYSTTGASGTFAPVPDAPTPGQPYLVEGRYTSLVQGTRVWTGTSGGSSGAFTRSVVNLDALAGRTVWFAWRFVTDYSVVAEGLYLDDVVLETRSSDCISCTVPAPPVPEGVAAAPAGDNRIAVTWTSSGASGHEVHRADPGAGFQLVGEVAAPPFVDEGRSGGATYRYVVRARSGCARSGPSVEATATATGPCFLAPAFAGLASAASSGSITCGNILEWAPATASCGGSLAYEVHRSTAAGFVPSPETRIATVTGLVHLDTGDLASGTAYHYVVRAVESGPGGAVSEGNAVEQSATPRADGGEFQDDFDLVRPADPGAWWTERATAGGDALALVSGCRWNSSSTAYRLGAPGTGCGGAYANYVQNTLVLGGDGSLGPNGFEIPTPGAVLSFRLWYDFESYYDGVSLLYSTTGASGPFALVPSVATPGAPYVAVGGYDGTASGSPAWTGLRAPANGALREVQVNLDGVAGRTVWFAWRLVTDGSVVREGLYLDDVALTGVGAACSTTPVPPGAATRFRVQGLPAALVADAPVTVTLTALDALGQVAVGYAGRAALTSTDAAAVLPAPVDFSAGVATAVVRLRTAGGQVVSAADAGNPAVRGSARADVRAAAPAALAFEVAPGSSTAGAALYPWPAVAVVDAFGNRTDASLLVTVALASNPGGGELTGSTTAASLGGVATFPWLYVVRAARAYTLAASAEGLLPATSPPFDVWAAYASGLAFQAQPGAAVAGEPISPAPAVALVDYYGNVTDTDGSPITLFLASGPPPGVALATAIPVEGVASFPDVSVDRAGSHVLRAAHAWLPNVESAPFEVVAGAPHRVVFAVHPGSVQAGVAFSPTVQALLRDRFDNPSSAAIPLSVALASNPSGGVLVGPTTAVSASGRVSFPGLAIDRPGAPYALYVGASGLAGDVSLGFDVRPGPTARYRVQGPAEVPAGTEVSYVATALDAAGDAVPGYSGTASVTTSDPLAEIATPAPGFSGGATAPVRITFRTPGAQTVRFADRADAAVAGTLPVGVGSPMSQQPPASSEKGGCGSVGGAGPGALALLALGLLGRRRALRAAPRARRAG